MPTPFDLSTIMELPKPKRPMAPYAFFIQEKLKQTRPEQFENRTKYWFNAVNGWKECSEENKAKYI